MDEILRLDPLQILGAIKRAIRRPRDAWKYVRFWWQTWDPDLKTSKGNFYFPITAVLVALGLAAWSWPGPFDLVLIPVAIAITYYVAVLVVRAWRRIRSPSRRLRPKRQRGTAILVLGMLIIHYAVLAIRVYTPFFWVCREYHRYARIIWQKVRQ